MATLAEAREALLIQYIAEVSRATKILRAELKHGNFREAHATVDLLDTLTITIDQMLRK